MPAPKIKIDPEFASLCPPLSEDELGQLEDSLQRDGCRDPLVVWKGHGILLDGHNRHVLCKKHGIDFQMVEVELDDRDAARTYVLHNQLGRRNLTPESASYLRGRRYLELKQQGVSLETSGQSDQKRTTASLLGEQYKVGEKTIRRDAKFAEAVDQIVSNCGDEYRGIILSRQYGLMRGSIQTLAKKYKPREQKKYLDELKGTGKRPRKPLESISPRKMVEKLVERIVDRDRDQALSVLREAAKRLGLTLVEEAQPAGSSDK